MAIWQSVLNIVGTRNDRVVKRLWKPVQEVAALEPEIKPLSDRQLRERTDRFRERLQAGETVDDLMTEAFAVVREAAWRVLKMRHYDVQIMGGIVLHQGMIAEMVTGEGKTLVATLAAYLNGLKGPGVHVVTVNDYLAQRDRDWMGPVFEFLGLSCGAIQSDMGNAERVAAYRCDITYGTNNEFGFDYLRDNMKSRVEDQVQSPRRYAIVDEVDSILIDEARTPLIIAGPAEQSTDKYYAANNVARKLRAGADFEVKEKEHQVIMTEEGIIHAQKILGVDDFYTGRNMDWPHHLEQSLKAHNLYKLDREYVIKDGDIVIVDEFTGRLMEGRRWSDGLHQAVEAKEGLRVKEENQTYATITLQNYFRMYGKLAGMTGTAMTEAGEFWKIYKLDVVAIPTNQTLRRDEYDDVIYATEREKYQAIVREIEDIHNEGRPLLIGTTSVEKSELLSGMLSRRGISHEVLNAKHHAREAEIVAKAGQRGNVTVATNMAGRGTDILLERGVPELGGLHIVGTERHESRRVDNQLRGRAGRQGDPGSSRFFLSMEDDLMRKFAGPKVSEFLGKLGLRDGEAIEHPWVTRSITSAQKKVENHNFEIRKNLLEYDEVNNEQRKLVYAMRQEVLEGKELKEKVLKFVEDAVYAAIDRFLPEKTPRSEYDFEGLALWVNRKLGERVVRAQELEALPGPEVEKRLVEVFRKRYEAREAIEGAEIMAEVSRFLLLSTIDAKWKDHLYTMDYLRSGIGMKGWLAQKDPKIMYKREMYDAFQAMLQAVADDVSDLIFRLRVRREDHERADDTWGAATARKDSMEQYEQQQQQAIEGSQGKRRSIKRQQPKVGRNEPCPCGSGKKYKKCHGQASAT